jgi:hypothetical protein
VIEKADSFPSCEHDSEHEPEPEPEPKSKNVLKCLAFPYSSSRKTTHCLARVMLDFRMAFEKDLVDSLKKNVSNESWQRCKKDR